MIIECGPAHDRRTLTLTIPDVERIGVFVSGGIDSTLLYYLILRETESVAGAQMIRPIVISRKEGSKYFAKPIIEHITQLFGINVKPVQLGNTALPEPEQVISAVKQAFALPPYFNAVYVGVIANRPEHLIGFDPIPVEPNDWVFMPFKNLEKCHIIDLYYQLGIEHLLKYTHSCDQHEKIPCGQCNGCRERIWGFQQLDRVDPLNT